MLLLSGVLVLLVESEDVLDALRRELIAHRRRFPSSPLPVVGATHGVGPAIAFCDPQPHLVLAEQLLERLTVDAARIEQCLRDLVAEYLLEVAVLEAAATQIPVRLRLLRIREHLAALVTHELVVDLP